MELGVGIMSPAEVEFLAEKELVTIFPNFSHGKIYLISGDVGPFVPSLPVQVPLWLAVNLKQRQKCRLLPLDWMNKDVLEEKKQEEYNNKFFTAMPSPHYREITQLLMSIAPMDIPHAEDIQTLIKDIWDIRMAKLRSSIDAFIKGEETHAKLDHLTLMEINTVRPLLTNTLNKLYQLRQVSSFGTSESQEW
ncbi:DNA replication complex GINS protein PSF2-like [Limulus polyphemus]|uniref:DNA replication complex GINS protein PSF2 n=1 Tax=Limulus polyphemus TaxID=6850 RepID=A0ABM1BCK6_LIMPO|nr:DNA replication complex GINS protein PSF2-like [Limulus polyphemus]